ncbi:MAG: hypothetical protein ACTHMI_06755 [Mucilaginibacter sp.]
MKRKLSITAALVCSLAVCLAAVFAGLNGKWSGNITTPDGQEVTLTYNIKVDGEKLTGTGESNGNTVNIDEGSLKGDDFTFKVTNTDGVVIPHSGRYYAQGDSVSMNIDYNGTKFHTTLKRDSK